MTLYLERMPVRKIAAALGIGEAAVRERLYRVKKKLKKLKEQYYDEEDE